MIALAFAVMMQCTPMTVTAYAATEFPGITADGSTTTWQALNGEDAIAAGSYDLPFGTIVEVEGLGTYRIADRGHLGAHHVDVLVPTRAEALEIGSSVRIVCVRTASS